MSALPLKTAISDVYPLPSNDTARVGFGALWDVLNEFTEKAELDLASAATTDIGGQLSTKLRITGTTGITSFGTTYRGPILIRFAGIVTLTHHATTLILPGAANITTSAGGTMIAYPKATVSGTADGWIVAFSSDYLAAQGALKLAKSGDTLTSYRETVVTANSTAAYAMDCSAANVFSLTLTANCTLSFTNIPSSVSFGVTLALKQDATGSRTVTWPTGTRWSGGTAPTLTTTAAKTDFISLFTLDGGTNWNGFVGGKNF